MTGAASLPAAGLAALALAGGPIALRQWTLAPLLLWSAPE